MTSAPFLLQIPVLPTEREQLLSQQKGVSRSGILAQHFLNLTDHKIITSQPAHIFYNHSPNLTGFNGIHRTPINVTKTTSRNPLIPVLTVQKTFYHKSILFLLKFHLAIIFIKYFFYSGYTNTMTIRIILC